jgi:hypothetical protein
LIALSRRFSRRPTGIGPVVAAIQAIAGAQITDRVVYLKHADGNSRLEGLNRLT